MKKVVIVALLMTLLVPQTVCAWGSRTHLEIAERMDGDYDFQIGCVLPDLSLALYYSGHGRDDLTQAMFHSPEFVDALWEVDGGEFTRGYVSHVESDKIEVAYSEQKISEGAPESADWPVDFYYPSDISFWIENRHRTAIQDALDIVYPGTTISKEDWWWIECAYHYYITDYSALFGDKQEIAETWYSDNDYYLWRSVYRSHIGILRGSAEMSDALWFVNQWLYGHAEMSEVLEVVNLWLYPRQ